MADGSRLRLDEESLTPHVLFVIAKNLSRAQRTLLRHCGEQLRRAANDCVETIMLTPLEMYPARHLKLLTRSFKLATKLILKGGFDEVDYSWIFSRLDIAAFFSNLKELDVVEAPCNDTFLGAILDTTKALQTLKARMRTAALWKFEIASNLTCLKVLHIEHIDEDTTLDDLSPLSNLVALETLYLNGELVRDVLTTLPTTLTSLSNLELINTIAKVIDLSPLQGRASLQRLCTWTCCTQSLFEQLLELQHLDATTLQLRPARDEPVNLVPLLPRLSELRNLVELTVSAGGDVYRGLPPLHYAWNLPDSLTGLTVLEALGVSSMLKAGQAPQLRSFSTNQASHGLLHHLALRTALQHLALPFCPTWEEPTAALPALPHVTHLTTTPHQQLPHFLKRGVLPALRSLKLEACGRGMFSNGPRGPMRVDNVLVDLLLAGLRLRELEVAMCDELTNAGLGVLVALVSLRRLCLRAVSAPPDQLGPSGLKVLLGHGGLEELEVVGCGGLAGAMSEEDVKAMCSKPGLMFWLL